MREPEELVVRINTGISTGLKVIYPGTALLGTLKENQLVQEAGPRYTWKEEGQDAIRTQDVLKRHG